MTDLEGRLRDTRNRAEKYKRTTLQAHARIAELERAVALSMQPPPAAPGEAVSPVGTADAFGALEGFLPHTNRPPLPVSDELANLRDVQATLTANRSCVAARLRRPSRALTWARGILRYSEAALVKLKADKLEAKELLQWREQHQRKLCVTVAVVCMG